MNNDYKFVYIIFQINDKVKNQFRFFIFYFNNLIVIRPASAETLLIFQRVFKNPDRKNTAQRIITTLRQKNKKFANYFAEFQ